MLLIKAVFV